MNIHALAPQARGATGIPVNSQSLASRRAFFSSFFALAILFVTAFAFPNHAQAQSLHATLTNFTYQSGETATGTFDYNPVTSTLTNVAVAVTVPSGASAGTYYIQTNGGNSSISSQPSSGFPNYTEIDLAAVNNSENCGSHSFAGLCVTINLASLPTAPGSSTPAIWCHTTMGYCTPGIPPSEFVYICGGTGCAFDNLTSGSLVVTAGGKNLGSGSPGQCLCGDPIDPASGNVFEQSTDYETAGQNKLSFTRYYNSLGASSTTLAVSLGPNWRSTYDRYIQIASSTQAIVERANGQQLLFTLSGTTWTPDTDVDAKLSHSGTTWTFTDHDDTVESYTTNGAGTAAILNSITLRNGYTQTLTYTGTQLTKVTDSYSRTLTLTYSGTKLNTMLTPESNTFSYFFNSNGTLARMTSPLDAPGGITWSYAYGNTTFPYALTGVGDRYGNTVSSWNYDGFGRATQSFGGGTSTYANNTSVAYNSNGTTTVTNAGGVADTYTYTILQNVPKVTGISRAATSTTPAMSRTLGYDSNGYLNSQTDWNGNSTTFVNDAHGDPTTINEAVGSSVARTTTITYDTTWVHLPDTIVTPGLTTGFTYSTSGNPLTRKFTDTSSQTVPYSTNGQTRTWTFTYDSTGHVLTSETPNLNTTTLTWTAGTLTKVSNPLSQAINITSYTTGSYPKTVVDPNSVSTALTYDAQMRLTNSALTTTAGVLNTQYAYWAGNYLYTTTLPDTSQWTRQPDDAERMKNFSDSYGNNIAYTLDEFGNWTTKQIFDSTNTLRYTHSATYDALERMLKDQGANSQVTTFTYDHNGNVLTAEDALSHTTTNTYDALNRLSTSTDANSGEVIFSYDAHDRPLTVEDKNGNTTTYVYNGFGDRIQQASPDSGTTVYHYDSDGNLTSKTDAASVVTNYTYDVLDRRATVAYPADSTENVTFTYDQTGHGSGIGRLTSVTDAAGTLGRTYDQRGNILTEARVTGGNTYTTTYTYDAISHVASITYPSGASVTIPRDLDGNVEEMDFAATGSDSEGTVLTGVTHSPFGPVNNIGYDNGDYVLLSYDDDYRPTLLNYFDYTGTAYNSWSYAYDNANNVHTVTDNFTPANSQTLGYDVVNRITSAAANGAYGAQSWTYDKNGNVLTSLIGGVSYTMTPTTGTNKLATTTWTGNSESYAYTATGNLSGITKNSTALFTLGYNKANRLITASGSGVSPSITATAYDPWGKRITKTGSTTSVYTYDLDGNLIEEKNGSTVTDYFYLDGILVGDWAPSQGHLYTINFDNRGVPLIGRDEYGLTTWEAAYSSPYGTMNITQTTGVYTGPMTENIRLPGQFFDKETGMHQNGVRDYMPGLGRYIQSDPMGLGGGTNTYLYGLGNPHKYTDSSGLISSSYIPGSSENGIPSGTIPGQSDNFTSSCDFSVFLLQVDNDPDLWDAFWNGYGGIPGFGETLQNNLNVLGAIYMGGTLGLFDSLNDLLGNESGAVPPQRGLGGSGWQGDANWRANVNSVGQGGTIESFSGYVPTQQEASDLIDQSGGTINRVDPPHDPPNPHTYPHINYTTSGGAKGTIRIQ